MPATKTNGTTNSPATIKERGISRQTPLDLFSQMRAEMDRVFGDYFPFSRATQWSPALDIYDDKGTTVVKVELPGTKKEDIHLTIDQGDLIIRGERKNEETVEEKDFMRMERSYGSFYRRIPLPRGVTEKDISAKQQDGVLEVRIATPPSGLESQTRIPIN